MKTGAKVLAGTAALALLTWTGTYLYWHVRILSAIRTLETQIAPSRDPAQIVDPNSDPCQVLSDAGCRSLPYLVAALDTPNAGNAMWNFFYWRFSQALPEGTLDAELKSKTDVVYDAAPKTEATAQERANNSARVRAWWREEGRLLHQPWRVWSSKCCSR